MHLKYLLVRRLLGSFGILDLQVFLLSFFYVLYAKAALQDNHRATVVGTKTFGKGRIQNLQELQDGAGISVTKAKYVTPSGRDIHGIGITPDIEQPTCGSNEAAKDCMKGIVL